MDVLPQDYANVLPKGSLIPLALSHHYLLNEITIPLEMLDALVKHTITCNM